MSKPETSFKKVAAPLKSIMGFRLLQEKFFYAIYTRNMPEIKSCVDKGVDPTWIHPDFGLSPLHLLAERNDYILGYHLITSRHVSNLDTKTYHGYTPLHLACMYSFWKYVNMLIQNGADLNVMDRNGKTALHWAVEKESPGIVKKLLLKGANINVLDSFENTPLSLAILNVKNFHIAGILLQKGINTEFENTRNLHIFFETVLECHNLKQINFIELLLKNGVDINIREPHFGRNCLHFVAITGYLELAVVLVERGAKIQTKDYNRRTPYKTALDHGNDHLAEYFKKGYKVPNIILALPYLHVWTDKLKTRISNKKTELELEQTAGKSKKMSHRHTKFL